MLLNLLLRPLVEVNWGTGLVGGEAGVGDHHGRGEDGRGGGGPDCAAGDGLHLHGGRQGLLLRHESAMRRKTQRETPTPDPPPWAARVLQESGLVTPCKTCHERLPPHQAWAVSA